LVHEPTRICMLQEIYIKNFVLIDELRMDFYQGLNVLTGETGAGKSIIIDALGLIIGGRINNDFIRDESQKAIVEAVFSLQDNPGGQNFLRENQLLDSDENGSQLIISREISPGGRNSSRINGRNVPLGMLRELATFLVDMHLQHDHLNILRPAMFIHYVDQFIENNDISAPLAAVYQQLSSSKKQLDQLKSNEQSRLQQVDLLTFQINEIEKVELQPGEEEALVALRNRIKNAGKLSEDAGHLAALMYTGEEVGNIFDLLGQTVEIIKRNQEEEFFAAMLNPCEDMYYSVQHLAGEIAKYRDSLDFEPGQLEEIEDRLHIINRLKAKYGKNIEEVLLFLNQARHELQAINNADQTRREYEQEIEKLEKEYDMLADKLTEKRKKAASVLQSLVQQELMQLNMPDIKFVVSLTSNKAPDANGRDEINFLFSPNPGEALRPLEKIASGGEMSRFILALKTALAAVYQVPTLIFDEIDVGVGGTALSAMAAKIGALAESHQVILVTHAPQVASFADHHFSIIKQAGGNRTITSVKKLDQNEKIEELARMMAGQDYSAITLQHAKEMIKLSGKA
jgi:DNA repair protein RecN (Recombination protein N)